MKVKVTQLRLAFCDPMDYTVHGILQSRILEGSLSLLQGINPGIEPTSPTLQADFLLAEPQGKVLPISETKGKTEHW